MVGHDESSCRGVVRVTDRLGTVRCSCGTPMRGRSVARGHCGYCETGTRPPLREPMETVDRDTLLREHAAWLAEHPDPWQRATDGLRMFVPDNGRGYWP